MQDTTIGMRAEAARIRSQTFQVNKRSDIMDLIRKATDAGLFSISLDFILCDDEQKFWKDLGYVITERALYCKGSGISW